MSDDMDRELRRLLEDVGRLFEEMAADQETSPHPKVGEEQRQALADFDVAVRNLRRIYLE